MTISPSPTHHRAPVRGESPSPAVTHRVISTAPPPTRARTQPSWRTPVDLGEVAAEQRALAWLDDPELPDQLPAEPGDTDLSARSALRSVRSSARRLPAAHAARLGLGEGATLGEAATALTRAVEDPHGPRCRSYRAAAYYLHDVHELTAVFDDL